MNKIAIIAIREFRTRLLTKASYVTLAIFVLAIVGGGWAVGHFVDLGDVGRSGVAFSNSVGPLQDSFRGVVKQAKLDDDFNISQCEDSRCQAQVQAGELDYAVVGTPLKPTLIAATSGSDKTRILLSQALDSLAMKQAVEGLGAAGQDFTRQLAQAHLEVNVLHADDKGINSQNFDVAAYLAAMIGVFMMFGMIVGSGSQVAMGVVEEKSSRVVEILLATVRPTQLMAGKILGISASAILQMLILGGSAVVGVKLSGLLQVFSFNLAGFSAWMLVWFILGLATYICLYAGLGALVNRQEEVGTMLVPVMFMQMIPLYAGFYISQTNPVSPWLYWMSLIPFSNAYTMPFRQVYSTVPVGELALSVGLNLLVIPLAVWVGATLYRNGILHTGSRLKLGAALGLRA